MPEFQFQEMFPQRRGHDALPQALPIDFVGTTKFDGRDVLTVEPEALTLLTAQAFQDISHLLRPGHLQQLRAILDDPEASANDKYVALELLKNANIAAGGVLPMCQDTGTAIVMGKKGQAVWTGGGDEAAIALRRLQDLHRDQPALFAGLAALDVQGSADRHQPAGADRHHGDRRQCLQIPCFVAKGGGSANKSYLLPADAGGAEQAALLKFLDTQIRTLGTAACPPYHLAIVVGGTSAETNLKTVKLASTRYLDDLPTEGNDKAVPSATARWRRRCWSSRQMGIGAQFGGKYFCHDVRVIRLPRHGASVPIGIGVCCSADRQTMARSPGTASSSSSSRPSRRTTCPRRPPQPGRRRGQDRPQQAMAHIRADADEASGEDARQPHRHADRGARHRPCQAEGTARSRRGPARLLQALPGLLRRPRQDAGRACRPAASARPRPAAWTPTSTSSRPPAARW